MVSCHLRNKLKLHLTLDVIQTLLIHRYQQTFGKYKTKQ